MMKVFQLVESARRTTRRGKVETLRRYRALNGRETLTVVSQSSFIELIPADEARPYSCRAEVIKRIRRTSTPPSSSRPRSAAAERNRHSSTHLISASFNPP